MNGSFFMSSRRVPQTVTVTKAHASAITIINAELCGTQVTTCFFLITQNICVKQCTIQECHHINIIQLPTNILSATYIQVFCVYRLIKNLERN